MKKVLGKSKKVYTITDKFSGQPSGYAFMLSDSFVSLDQVQLFPWQAPQSQGQIQPDKEGESESRGLAPGSLASDLDISEDSSVNSTVEDGLSVSGQELNDTRVEEILDMSSGSRVNADNNITEDTQIDVDDTKFSAKNNNWNPVASVSNTGTSYKSVAQTLAAEIASNLVAEKRLAGMDKDSFGSSKSLRESPVKRKCDQSVPGKFSPGIQNRFAAFFTDVGVTQPEDNTKRKLVRCLLCKEERIIGVANFARHVRTMHEPPVECDICGGEYSAERIRVHKKICIARSFKSQEMRAPQELRLSKNQLKSENEEVKFKFKEMRAQEPRLNENQLKSENEEVKFKLTSATRPEIGIKVTLKRNVKIKKAMKIFAEKFNVSRKKLSFVIRGVKLTGDELVSELEGKEIIVHGKVN